MSSGTIGATEVIFMIGNEVNRLKSRIAELERQRITDEQINLIWSQRDDDYDDIKTLESQGVTACKECNGVGRVSIGGPPCNNCNGQGWTRE